MINEESRVMLFPHTINRVGQDIVMVARNWFDFFSVEQMKSLVPLKSGTVKEVKLTTMPTSVNPSRPAEEYICRLVDNYIVMDSTSVARTIQVLANKVWEITD